MKFRRVVLFAILLVVGIFSMSACSRTADSEQVKLTLAPESALPDNIRNASPEIQETYRFAIANQAILRQIPCYCGCSAIGHENNLQCYIQDVKSDGEIVFDNHAYG